MSTDEELYVQMLERLSNIYRDISYNPLRHAHLGDHFNVARRCAQALYSMQSALENKDVSAWQLPVNTPIHFGVSEREKLTTDVFTLITTYVNENQLEIYTSPTERATLV